MKSALSFGRCIHLTEILVTGWICQFIGICKIRGVPCGGSWTGCAFPLLNSCGYIS